MKELKLYMQISYSGKTADLSEKQLTVFIDIGHFELFIKAVADNPTMAIRSFIKNGYTSFTVTDLNECREAAKIKYKFTPM